MSNRRNNQRPLIWIVDDSRTEAAITERSLGTAYDYEWFADGSFVVERLAGGGEQPDLLLLDWVMPGVAGDDVCRFVRSHPATQDLTIIVVTASRIETADIVHGLTSGANDYVARPFAAEELRARVEAALRTKQLKDAAKRERDRLRSINRLGHALLHKSGGVEQSLTEVATELTVSICDACSILILPGPLPPVSVSRHRHDPTGQTLSEIAAVADPVVHAFASSDEARATLPPAYRPYIDRFGMSALAILPFPIREPVRGVVTLIRDGNQAPFDADDIATIETCIEYASLAVESSMQLDAERIGRAQLDAVLSSLPVGILATDANGSLTLVNAAARELLPAISDAKNLHDVFEVATWSAGDGTPLGEADWVLRDTVHSQLPVSAELRLSVPGETVARTVAVAAVPLRDGRGSLVGSVTVLQDVSAERQITAERERMARFQQEMIGIVGHDLRNPLSAVLAGSEILMLQAEQAPEMSSVLTRIQASIRRMVRIIDQLLDVTRARLGSGIAIAPHDCALVPLVTSVIDELTLAYPQTKFELRRADEIQGHWDADRLGQVLSNLLSNAALYGRPGEPVVVEIIRDDAVVTVKVRNAVHGKPIPPDVLATIFTPFRRATKRNTGGLGLGLYIVHEIVRSHGGTVDVQSTERETEFRLVLPLRPGATVTARAP